MKNIKDNTVVNKKNLVIILVSIIGMITLIFFSMYRYFDIGFWSPVEFFAEIMIIFVLIYRAEIKVTCELEKKSIRITKKSWLGSQVFDIPYQSVFGMYRYVPKLISTVKFRRTYRLHSALDPRPVWTLAYQVEKNGKTENQRIYYKVGEEFLNGLQDRLPNKVGVSEEQVLRNIILAKKP